MQLLVHQEIGVELSTTWSKNDPFGRSGRGDQCRSGRRKSSNDSIGNDVIHAVAQSPGRLIDLLGKLSL
jgi:hypothetical protein